MSRRVLGVVLAMFVLGAGPAWLTLNPAAASPSADQQCTTTSGAIVAVDFGHWGGPIVRGCGATPTTGYALLNQHGFHSVGTSHDGPGFVCRIASSSYHGGTAYPTAKEDPCVRTSSAGAYWSYWHANPGQRSWTYSVTGLLSYQPRPGSVDLWQFGATDISGSSGRPDVDPSQLRAVDPPRATAARSATEPREPSSVQPSTSSGRRTSAAPRSSPRSDTGAGSGTGSGTGTATGTATGTGAGATPGAVPGNADASSPGSGTDRGTHAETGDTATSTMTTPAGAPGGSSGSTSVAPIASGSTSSGSRTGSTSAGRTSPRAVASEPRSGEAAGAPQGRHPATVVDAGAGADTGDAATRSSVRPFLVALALIVVLAGGAALTVWRRRQS